MNLYRLPSDQLSFLQQYVGKLNTEVEERKEKLVQDWKSSIQQEENEEFEKEMKRTEKQMKLLDLKRQYLKEKRQDGETSAEKQNQGERGTRKDVRGRCGNRYDYDSDTTARGVPGRRYRGYYAPPPAPPIHRPPQPGFATNPATLETPWTIEEVELTFIPEKVRLATPGSGNRHLGLHTFRIGDPVDEVRGEVKLEVATNVIAPESFSSFAVVLSRSHGVECDNILPSPYYSRGHSPARSYQSGITSQDEAEGEEWAETVEKLEPPKTCIFPVGYPPMGGPPPFWNPTPGAPVPSNVAEEQKGSEAPSETGKDEDSFETESKAEEEGEGCGEGTVYVSVVKRTE